jgi:hypothetical protein
MTWRDFEAAERIILERAPAALRNLYEVKLRIARERLGSGEDVMSDVTALQRELAGFANERQPG